ncbi:hypothetical protein ACF0H5_019760 [Mactra antiquata]
MGCTCEKIKIRKASKIGDKAEVDNRPPKLSVTEICVIRNNWQILKCHVANIGVITYVGMFEGRPEMKEVFSKFRNKDVSELRQTGLLRQHALRVMATIDKCITRLDEPSSLIPMLREVGVNHKKYKVPPDSIQIILPHFLNAIKPHIEDYWCAELADAWTKMFELIIFHIKEGMVNTDERHRDFTASAQLIT